MQVLRIPEGCVLRDSAVRQNLRLSVLRSSGGKQMGRTTLILLRPWPMLCML
jgi:hypothetical protein